MLLWHRHNRPSGSRRASQLTWHSGDECMRELLLKWKRWIKLCCAASSQPPPDAAAYAAPATAVKCVSVNISYFYFTLLWVWSRDCYCMFLIAIYYTLYASHFWACSGTLQILYRIYHGLSQRTKSLHSAGTCSNVTIRLFKHGLTWSFKHVQTSTVSIFNKTSNTVSSWRSASLLPNFLLSQQQQ